MPPIVLPDAASGSIDWDQLVTVASHALDGTIFQQSVLFNNNNNKCGVVRLCAGGLKNKKIIIIIIGHSS